MPIAMRKESVHRLVLGCDQELPPDQQPVFLARVMTGHDESMLTETLSVVRGKPSVVQQEAAVEVLNQLIIGWENLTNADGEQVMFGERTFDQILTNGEIWELVELAFHVNRITPGERGNSGSPSSVHACAGSAQQGGAAIPQPNTSLPKSSAPTAADSAVTPATVSGMNGSPNVHAGVSLASQCVSSGLHD